MIDQAERLRQIINNIKIRQAVNITEVIPEIKKKTARVITVTSGKGGVGKTNITTNLAIQLSDLGQRVNILDADFGLANVDVLFGIIPKYTLVDVIHNEKSILEVLADGPGNVKFISGGSGAVELIKLDKEQLDNFVRNISLLDKISDIILIDTGAGLSDTVMSFIMAADEVILVTTPEPTSITDAYALIKMVANKDKNKIIKLLVNKAESAYEANELFNKLKLVTEKFLELKIESLGYVLNDNMVIRAVKMQKPFSINFPKSVAARQLKEISEKLIEIKEENNDNVNKGVKGFITRLVTFLNN